MPSGADAGGADWLGMVGANGEAAAGSLPGANPRGSFSVLMAFPTKNNTMPAPAMPAAHLHRFVGGGEAMGFAAAGRGFFMWKESNWFPLTRA